MADHKDETLSGLIELDGKTFENIVFKGAQLVYDGGKAPVFKNCQFQDASFSFRNQAANTLMFLRGMAPQSTGMRTIVEGLIPEMKG